MVTTRAGDAQEVLRSQRIDRTQVHLAQVLGVLHPHYLGEAIACEMPWDGSQAYVVALDPSLSTSADELLGSIDALATPDVEGIPTRPIVVRLADRRLGLAYSDIGTVCLNDLVGGQPAPRDRAFSILRQIANLLGPLHSANVSHAGLTLQSVMLTVGDRRIDTVSLADYGLRQIFPEPRTWAPTAPLSCIPMSPERVLGLPCDVREDVYALGCIAFALFTGEQPLLGEDLSSTLRRHSIEDAPALETYCSGIENAGIFAPIVAKALAKEPADRFEDARAFDRALANAMRDGKESSTPRLKRTKLAAVALSSIDRIVTSVRDSWDEISGAALKTAHDQLADQAQKSAPVLDSAANPTKSEDKSEQELGAIFSSKQVANSDVGTNVARSTELPAGRPAPAENVGTKLTERERYGTDPFLLTDLVSPCILLAEPEDEMSGRDSWSSSIEAAPADRPVRAPKAADLPQRAPPTGRLGEAGSELGSDVAAPFATLITEAPVREPTKVQAYACQPMPRYAKPDLSWDLTPARTPDDVPDRDAHRGVRAKAATPSVHPALKLALVAALLLVVGLAVALLLTSRP